MRILALEPNLGGSHRAFLEGWARGSRHELDVRGLPPRHWKWRMRHGAVTLARAAAEGGPWDAVVASSMLDLAAWRGLAPSAAARLPALLYFHENQLTYPSRRPDVRDLHFAYTHFTSCLAADAIAFNSAFHRDAFLDALEAWLRSMPDHRHLDELPRIRARSRLRPPGVDDIRPGPDRPERAPATLLWAARWEHDKGPEDFFAALARLAELGVPFRMNVVGEGFRDRPAIFDEARAALGDRVGSWGYVEDRADYLDVLRASDVVVSTARHEFFGIAVVEAVLAGCVPVLPDRLSYPEVLGVGAHPERRAFLHDGSVDGLANRLARFCSERRPDTSELRKDLRARYGWPGRREELDSDLDSLSSGRLGFG